MKALATTSPATIALVAVCIMGASAAAPAHAQSLPLAEPNHQRTPAGRTVDGELRVELDAVEAEWYPRGTEGRFATQEDPMDGLEAFEPERGEANR